MNSPEYIDERYCGHCEEDTMQTCRDDTHERDSSHDYQKCHKCGWEYRGMRGKWEPESLA